MKMLMITSLMGLMSAVSTGTFAQEYDVKKDIILKDKVPYAKIGGKVGLSNTNIAINSLNGDSLIKITKWIYPGTNPQFQLFGYKVQFVDGRSITKLVDFMLVNKEQVLAYILKDRDFSTGKRDNEFNKALIVNNVLDEAVVAEFIAKYNHESVIKEADEFQAKEKEMLSGLFPMTRNRNQPVKFVEVNAETTDVMQDNVRLITIIKKTETNSLGTKYIYTFKRNLVDPFVVGGKKYYTLTLATATCDSFPKLYVNASGKAQDVRLASPAHAESELIDILIKNNYL